MTNDVQYVLRLKDLFSDGIQKAKKETDDLNDSFNKASSGLKTFAKASAVAFAIEKVIGFGKELLNTKMQLEGIQNQMSFASGSAKQGGADFDYVRQQSKKMGLDLISSAEAFAKLEGATRGTAIAGQKTRDIFEGVGMASTVMHLSSEQSNGAFLALSQMMSKGKISAEELNGQLGERIPGALGIASRSMGMTTKDLMKMMQNGELMSEVFLPRFANQLKTEFAGGMAVASKSATADFNRMNNSILETKLTLAELSSNVLTGVVSGIQTLMNHVQDFAKNNRDMFTNLMQFFSNVWDGIKPIAYVIGGLVRVVMEGVHAILWGFNQLGGVGKVIIGLTGAVWLLNVAMTANPVGAIVVGFVSLIGAVSLAWKKFDGFRATMMGVWEVVKGLAKSLIDLVIGFHSMDFSRMKRGFNSLFDVKKNFNAGYNNEMIATRKAKEKEKKQDLSTQKLKSTNFGGGGVLPPAPASTETPTSSKVSSQKPTNIYINIGKLIETQNIKVENATKDFTEKLHTAVAEVLLNVVNDSNRIATQ